MRVLSTHPTTPLSTLHFRGIGDIALLTGIFRGDFTILGSIVHGLVLHGDLVLHGVGALRGAGGPRGAGGLHGAGDLRGDPVGVRLQAGALVRVGDPNRNPPQQDRHAHMLMQARATAFVLWLHSRLTKSPLELQQAIAVRAMEDTAMRR